SSSGESYVDLGKLKRATVSAFGKGVYLNLREYYLDKSTGEAKPGKKGITLTLEQWETLKEHADEIDRAF
ncbi:transcription cofactor Pc4, partial [Punctularia strigosozonata HHB-11173 SS5]|uniref:transcription cofactor Pc4 n=1 Tax=Punctularia strigosozonata (strain HHB-11173) TaxID=741275 RepID=UPI0004417D13